jgi:hypothetical protein
LAHDRRSTPQSSAATVEATRLTLARIPAEEAWVPPYGRRFGGSATSERKAKGRKKKTHPLNPRALSNGCNVGVS